MNIIVIPDSFKGTMTAAEVCGIISRAVRTRYPDAEVRAFPLADGGEGTCEAFYHALGGEMVSCDVHGPHMEPVSAEYWKKDGTAVIELAQAAGFITDAAGRDPAVTTTYGVGELIRHAIGSGCGKIILGLGGSCTNDAGTGIAAALGAVFTDARGEEFLPTGNTLKRITDLDLTELKRTVEGIRFEAMCDVDNPLCGPAGAAYVFAPQKGADEVMVKELDRNLRAFADLIKNKTGEDIAEKPGAGAAGGAGAGAELFLNAPLRPGAQIVLEMFRFDELLKKADLVITGEGRLDSQSLRGKAVITAASRAKAGHVPVIAVVGTAGEDLSWTPEYGIVKVVRTIDYCDDPASYEKTCREDLFRAVLLTDLTAAG